MNPSVAIIGCGWLGIQVAKKLLESGYSVTGSTTRPERLHEIRAVGITAQILNLESAEPREIAKLIGNSGSVIISIPPKSSEYPGILRKAAMATGDRQIIFTSSISVYPNKEGEVDETAQTMDSALSNAERIFPDAAILRLGGLVGKNRHPVYSLAGKKNIANPDAPINLVHADDCVRAIMQCIGRNVGGTKINVVAPWHPTRRDYYQEQAKMRNLPVPQFQETGHQGKIVGSNLISKELGFYPDANLIK